MIITYHMSVQLAWALRRPTAELRAMLRHETGQSWSGWDVRRRLRQAQQHGYTVLPVCPEVNAKGYCLGHRSAS
jgi:hypothetical protein